MVDSSVNSEKLEEVEGVVKGDEDLDSDVYRLLIPVSNPDHVDELMRTGIDVAEHNSGEILVISIISIPKQTILSKEFLEKGVIEEKEMMIENAVDFAEERGVSAVGKIVRSHDVAKGVVKGVEENDADAVLMGWRGRPRKRDILVGSNIDRVTSAADCDVLVEKVGEGGEGREIKSILLPAAEGPHAELGSEVAEAIAKNWNAEIRVVRVVREDAPEREVEEERRILEEVESKLEHANVSSEIVEGEDVIDSVVEMSSDYEITVLGAAREGLLRQIVFGTIPEEVGRRSENTVIMARRNAERSGSIYDWLVRKSL